MESKSNLSFLYNLMLIFCSTLEQIAEHGSKAFYEGEIGMYPILYQIPI